MTNREYLIKILPSGAIIKGLTSDWLENDVYTAEQAQKDAKWNM